MEIIEISSLFALLEFNGQGCWLPITDFHETQWPSMNLETQHSSPVIFIYSARRSLLLALKPSTMDLMSLLSYEWECMLFYFERLAYPKPRNSDTEISKPMELYQFHRRWKSLKSLCNSSSSGAHIKRQDLQALSEAMAQPVNPYLL